MQDGFHQFDKNGRTFLTANTDIKLKMSQLHSVEIVFSSMSRCL